MSEWRRGNPRIRSEGSAGRLFFEPIAGVSLLIDVHSHILPGIDDGAESWEVATDMARAWVADGVHTVAATPHMMPDGQFANGRSDVLPLVEEANERFRRLGIPLTVVAGGELYAAPDLADRIAGGELLTYGDQGRYALVEMPGAEIPAYMEQILFDCQVRRITPVLAHPERNQGVAADVEWVAAWIERGGLVQVNARSLLGASGGQAQALAEELVKRRMVHLVASDAHSVRRRPPGLAAARERIAQLAGGDMAGILVEENPGRLLAGDALLQWEPLPPEKRGWWRRLLGRRR